MERTDGGPQIHTAGTSGIELSFNKERKEGKLKKTLKINLEHEISK